MKVTETLGERINDIRKKHNMTQTAFGECFGVQYQIVSAWENDKRVPSTEVLQKMADTFRCSFYWLSTGNDDTNHVVCEELALTNDTVNMLKLAKHNTMVKAVLHSLVTDWKVLEHIYDYLNSDFKNLHKEGTFDMVPVSTLSDFDSVDLETVKGLRLLDDFKRMRKENKGGIGK